MRSEGEVGGYKPKSRITRDKKILAVEKTREGIYEQISGQGKSAYALVKSGTDVRSNCFALGSKNGA